LFAGFGRKNGPFGRIMKKIGRINGPFARKNKEVGRIEHAERYPCRLFPGILTNQLIILTDFEIILTIHLIILTDFENILTNPFLQQRKEAFESRLTGLCGQPPILYFTSIVLVIK
jgi:hypothetical protein